MAVGGLALVRWRLRVGRRLTPLRALSGIMGTIYVLALVYYTFLPLSLGPDPNAQPWWVWIQPVPFQDLLDDPIGLILNVALFIPLGILAPLLVRAWRWWQAALVGLLTSATIEALQFIGDLTISAGRVVDIDDLIANLAGAVLGFLLLRLAMVVPRLRGIAEKASWPSFVRDHRHIAHA